MGFRIIWLDPNCGPIRIDRPLPIPLAGQSYAKTIITLRVVRLDLNSLSEMANTIFCLAVVQ